MVPPIFVQLSQAVPLHVLTNTIALTGEPDIHSLTLMYTTPRPSSLALPLFLFTKRNSLRKVCLGTLLFIVFVFYIVTYHLCLSINNLFFYIQIFSISLAQVRSH